MPDLVRVAATASVLATVLVGVVRWDALRRGVLDLPNARSSHHRPTPRGGGLGLLVALALALLAHFGARIAITQWPAIVAVAIVALVGWVDDHGHVPVRLRLLVHVGAGVLLLPLASSASFGLPGDTAPGAVVLGLLALWWVFWTVSAINVLNFIDGIDGIVGAQVIVFGVHLAVLGESGGPAAVFGVALAAASVGFLAWNWHPARIFLGDVGSGALGVVTVIGGALLLREQNVRFIVAFAPLAPIFLDAAVTLGRRARRGDRLSEAHRLHLYQRLVQAGHGHGRVALLYAGASLGVVIGAERAAHAGFLACTGLLLLLVVAGGVAERSAMPFPRR